MEATRKISRIIHGAMTMDGAGVRLKRMFGFHEEGLLDPFLLLDLFGSDNPADYMAGFPWHPHRGMETVTYMLAGRVEHGDSMGNKGVIGPGDVQWMTAGSGIIHQEMPRSDEARMYGFQLWVNLPASHKMMPPRYQEIKSGEIPIIHLSEGSTVKVIAGKFKGMEGPVKDIVADPLYIDVSVPENGTFEMDTHSGYTVFACVFEGACSFGEGAKDPLHAGEVALFGDGENIKAVTDDKPARFILVSGKPLHEPVAWRGPIVMNTQEELDLAFKEFREGRFVK